MLPSIDLPIYDLVIPSTQQEIKVRPFTVKEEKLLFMAHESKDFNEVVNTVMQVIRNCVLEGDVNLEKLPFFDIDFIFIFLRSKSVGESVELTITCNNTLEDGSTCGHMFNGNIDIAHNEVVKPELSDKIDLGGGKGVKMKYPAYSVIKTIENAKNLIDKKTAIIVNSIDYIYDKDSRYSSKDFSKEELTKFVEDLTEENYTKLQNYVEDFPVVLVKLDITCPKCKHEHKLRYSDLQRFFM